MPNDVLGGGSRARITFEVEGVPFALDRKPFEESEVFQDMFSLPTNREEGTSLTNPVYLGGIQVCDFCAFIDALTSPDEASVLLSVEEWKVALRLAHMWCFERVMARAIRVLDGLLDDASKVELSIRYDYLPWYYPALRRLAERRESLTACEVEQVGWDIACGIQGVREILSKVPLEDLEHSAQDVHRITCSI